MKNCQSYAENKSDTFFWDKVYKLQIGPKTEAYLKVNCYNS